MDLTHANASMNSRSTPLSLVDLPYELLYRIIHNSDAGLNSDDIRALRLVCRRLAFGPAISLLFHTIAISRLQRDVDSFLGIASTPYLASEVKVIIWHELISDIPALDWPPDITDPGCTPSLVESIRGTLRQQVRPLHWKSPPEACAYVQGLLDAAPSTSMAGEEEHAHTASIKPFPLVPLLKAMDSMVNIHTVVSNPMHGLRRITHLTDTTSYPLTAQSLTSALLSPTVKSPTRETNFGFFNFLLFAVAARPADQRIRRLCFSDEGNKTSFVPLNLHLDQLHAFLHLTHLNFCISQFWTTNELFHLGQFIRSAGNLQHLDLCFEKCGCVHRGALDVILIGHVQDKNWRLNLPQGTEFKWKSLRELRLSECPFSAGALGDFMRRQSDSLKRLHLHDCRLTGRDLLTIARANRSCGDLKLDQFTILESGAGDTDPFFDDYEEIESMSVSSDDSEDSPMPGLTSYHWVSEKRLVDLMNVAFSAGDKKLEHQLAAELAKVTNRFLVYTHIAKFDSETSHTAFVCETRLGGNATSQLYDLEEVHQADVENGDLRDSMGYSYQPGTHYNPVEEASGLYLDHSINDEGSGDEMDIDTEEVPQYESFDYTTGSHGGDDDEFDDGWRWVLCRDFKRDIYFWRERQGDDKDRYPEALDTESPRGTFGQYTSRKYKTEIWRFTHRNGEMGVGRDPLEFWHDWEGAEAGDLAEPLPFGYAFVEFLNMTMSKQGPTFQCSAEYILARDGTRFKPEKNWIEVPEDVQHRETELAGECVNRVDWAFLEENANWTWSTAYF